MWRKIERCIEITGITKIPLWKAVSKKIISVKKKTWKDIIVGIISARFIGEININAALNILNKAS